MARRIEFGDCPIVSIDCQNNFDQTIVLIGDLEGNLRLLNCKNDGEASSSWVATTSWEKKQTDAVRRVRFGHDNKLYSICADKSLTQWDTETGKPVRTVENCHDPKPLALHVFSRNKTEFVATGDEDGDVRLWDFRLEEPMICEFTEHEEYVTDLCSVDDGKTIISTSGDSSLAAYSLAAKKVLMASENLNSELSSVCPVTTSDGKKRILCGGGDGHLEVFKQGEYGNILERIETAHIEATIDCIRYVGNNMVATSSSDDGSIQLLQLSPHVPLAEIGEHGEADGVEEITVTPDLRCLISSGHDGAIEFWDLSQWKKRKLSLEGPSASKDSSSDDSDSEVEEEDEVPDDPKANRRKAKAMKKPPLKVNKEFFKSFGASLMKSANSEEDSIQGTSSTITSEPDSNNEKDKTDSDSEDSDSTGCSTNYGAV